MGSPGRLHNKKNLMDELAKMDRVITREAPASSREVLLVLDATTGSPSSSTSISGQTSPWLTSW